MKEPGKFVLDKLVNNPDTPRGVVNRVTLVAGMYDGRGYDDVFEKCVRSGEPWPKVFGPALYGKHVPAFARYDHLKSVVFALDTNVRGAAKPLTCDTLPSHIPARHSKDYKLKKEPEKEYLVELIGEDNVKGMENRAKEAQETETNGTAGPSGPAAIPLSSNRSRMLGRRTGRLGRPQSAFPATASLVPLGRPAPRPAPTPSSSTSGRSVAVASAAMRQHNANASRKKVRQISDPGVLPPAPDSLRARTMRREEKLKKIQEAEAKKKLRKEERMKAEEERRRLRSARKRAVAQEHREEQRLRDEDDDFIQEDDVETAVEQSPQPLGENEAAMESNGEEEDEIEDVVSPGPSKKRLRRLDEDHDEVPVPRRTADSRQQPRSGPEAHAARARLSRGSGYMSANSPRSVARANSHSPRSREAMAQFRRNTVIAPAAMRAETERRRRENRDDANAQAEETDLYRQAVGEECQSLSAEDRRLIIDFLNPSGGDPGRFFQPGEEHREIVLDEHENDTLMLRIKPDGGWSRVRFSNGPVQHV